MLNNKILIIDDEQTVIDSIKSSLEREEYQILSANNGKEGVEIYKKEKPILILLDLRMPVMDGIEFLEHLKLTPSDPSFVIVLTSHGDDKAIKRCFSLGISSFLKKPFNIFEIRGLISHSITLKQTQIELTRINNKLVNEVDERKKIEIQLLKLSTAVEQIPSVVMITDTTGCIEYVNPKFTELTGYTSKEVLGKNPRFLKAGDQNKQVYIQLWTTITAGHEWHGDLHNKKKNDKLYWESSAISPIRDAKGQITHFVKTAEDSTMRKLAEEELKKAHDELEYRVKERTTELKIAHKKLLHSEKLNALGKLTASFAHEFNNPLYGVLNVFEIIAEETESFKDSKVLIDMAIRECFRMADLIRKLEDFNRPSPGIVQPMDIHKAIDEILMLCQTKFKKRNIELVKDYAIGMPKILIVDDQVKQVLLNILNNAEQSIPGEGGKIRLLTEYTDSAINIHIQDSGCGIKSEDLKHIFEPFFTTKAVKGIGLGLSVSYGIIKKHGGDINVKSIQGSGTTFTITIPVNAKA